MTVVKHITDSHDSSGLNTGRQEVLYGTHNGVLGQLFVDRQAVKQGWQVKATQHKGNSEHQLLSCLLQGPNAALAVPLQLAALHDHVYCLRKAHYSI